MDTFKLVEQQLRSEPKKWVVTGVAGFIGSNLLEALLKLDQLVIGLDNFSTGHLRNLEDVKNLVTPEQWAGFQFVEGDVCDLGTCREVCKSSDYVLHQAALGSVPRSIEDPISTNKSNIDGFLNMLVAARDSGVERFVYAASSSTYGDSLDLPKVEDKIGNPLSPYAVTKLVNEIYSDVFARVYSFKTIGLRYFNIFGRRQDPNGMYAAVIPQWIASMIKNEPIYINGDGETSRDFCYVDNAVQANILAATVKNESAANQVYNVAVGGRTTLNQLYDYIHNSLSNRNNSLKPSQLVYRDFRIGDVHHSMADINKARILLGYRPSHQVFEGLDEAMDWYIHFFSK